MTTFRQVLLACGLSLAVFAGCVVLGVLVLAPLLLWENGRRRDAPSVAATPVPNRLANLYQRSRVVLSSRLPDGEVRIPFVERDGIPCLQGVWAGKPVRCVLDTGAASVTWPRSLRLKGTVTDIAGPSNWAGGLMSQNRCVVLPSIRLGACELQQFPTMAFEEITRPQQRSSSRNPLRRIGAPMPSLGAAAFRGLVLTTDPAAGNVLLRAAGFDVTRAPHRAGSRLLDVAWDQGYLPVVRGRLNGRPARYGIDTGTAAIIINRSSVALLRGRASGKTVSSSVNGCQVITPSLRAVGAVGGYRFQSGSAPVIEIPADVDGLVGWGFLKHFRMTLDYRRGKMLLDPDKE